jgi:hypothetical protein
LSKPSILVVDDTAANIKILADLLRRDYLLRVARTSWGVKAFDYLSLFYSSRSLRNSCPLSRWPPGLLCNEALTYSQTRQRDTLTARRERQSGPADWLGPPESGRGDTQPPRSGDGDQSISHSGFVPEARLRCRILRLPDSETT